MIVKGASFVMSVEFEATTEFVSPLAVRAMVSASVMVIWALAGAEPLVVAETCAVREPSTTGPFSTVRLTVADDCPAGIVTVAGPLSSWRLL